MRPFRLFFTFLSCILLLVLFSFARSSPPQAKPDNPAYISSKKHDMRALFSWSGPSALFPPTAKITLTDDNATFFLARPAYFGPTIPEKGFSGELWSGGAFTDGVFHSAVSSLGYTGELGCSDIPGWDWDNSDVHYPVESEERSLDALGHLRAHHTESKASASLGLTDVQSLQEMGEIQGKIALLSRGGCGFLEKVLWAQRRGATALIVGDNVRGGQLVGMYARGDTSDVRIPAVFTTHTTAQLLSSLVPSRSGHDFKVSPAPRESERRRAMANRLVQKTSRATPGVLTTLLGLIPEYSDVETADDVYNTQPVSLNPYTPDGTEHREGLWVTLSPYSISSSPFFDTLLVLVVSPLVTLTIVYSLLLLRSRIRRRRWRAPKSVVARLPVRTYQTLSSESPPISTIATPVASSPTTPLLSTAPQPSGRRSRPWSHNHPEQSSSYGSSNQRDQSPDSEKRESGLSEWRRRSAGRQKECVVCLEEYEDGVSRVMSLPCGHEFHAACITPWLTTRRRTCPICKGDVVRSMRRLEGSMWGGRVAGGSLDEEENDLHEEEDEVQDIAALARNDSPDAQRPVDEDELYRIDVEGSLDEADDAREEQGLGERVRRTAVEWWRWARDGEDHGS